MGFGNYVTTASDVGGASSEERAHSKEQEKARERTIEQMAHVQIFPGAWQKENELPDGLMGFRRV